VLVRLAYVAELPAPEEAPFARLPPRPPCSRRLGMQKPDRSARVARVSAVFGARMTVPSASAAATRWLFAPRIEPMGSGSPSSAISSSTSMATSFAEVVALVDKRREATDRLAICESACNSLALEPACRIAVSSGRGSAEQSRDASANSSASGTARGARGPPERPREPTLREQEQRRERDCGNEVADHPLVGQCWRLFREATVVRCERFSPAEGRSG